MIALCWLCGADTAASIRLPNGFVLRRINTISSASPSSPSGASLDRTEGGRETDVRYRWRNGVNVVVFPGLSVSGPVSIAKFGANVRHAETSDERERSFFPLTYRRKLILRSHIPDGLWHLPATAGSGLGATALSTG